MKENSDKQKMLDLSIAQIEKNYGKGSIMRLGDNKPSLNLEVVPSGSIGVDLALGVGGYPRGRIIEIFGPESSGKTTLTLHAVAQAQKLGGVAAFIDAEHALDLQYAKRLGVDIKNLLVAQPDYGEQAMDITETLVRSNAVDIIVVDSVAALTPKAEIEGEMGDSHMGLQARLMSQALRKLTATISKSSCIVIFINQLRMKIGVMFGNPETTTGGNALKFYSSIRVDVRKISAIKNKDEIIGNTTRVKIVKNKVAPPFRTAQFDMIFGEGISRIGELIDLAVEKDIIKKSGSWYSFNEERIGQGREKVKQVLMEDSALCEKIENLLLTELNLRPTEEVTEAAEEKK